MKDLTNLHENIAADALPNGAHLRCNTCHKKRKASAGECAKYLRTGWPTCCGVTMEMVAELAKS